MYIELLKEMFSEMVEKKNAGLISKYYHEAFEMYANGIHQHYAEFHEFHANIYQTDIQYKISYDETTFVEQGEKIAARVYIVTTKPREVPRELELILICEFKDHKIYKLWELCYPDWSKMPEFSEAL